MKRLFTVGYSAVLAVACLSAAAHAQIGKKGGPNKFIERLKAQDVNGDGKITKTEAKGPLRQRFAKFDANGDGVIDQAELKKLSSRFGKGRPQFGGGGVAAGNDAPDFQLKSLDGKQTAKLSDFKNKNPVALIFGSYT